MKKITSIVLAIALCLSLTLIFTSCSLFKHPIEKVLDEMEEENNYAMTVTMSDIPFLGTMKMTTKVDGNVQYTPAVLTEPESYVEIFDDYQYVYTKTDDGSWTKSKEALDNDSDALGDYEELLDPKNYEKVKGEKKTYKQKDDVEFDNFDDVVIEITDDGLIIKASMEADGITCDVKIEISDIGEIDLTLPKTK